MKNELLLACLVSIFSSNCSDRVSNAARSSFPISIKLTYATPKSLNLESEIESNLRLVSTGTNLTVSVSSCTSGYSVSSTSINSGVINLYKGDRNCLVKLTGFTLGSVSYSPIGGTNFTTWLNNDVATFKNTAGSDTIKVYVNSQVTQAGVQTSDTVVYKFTDLASTTTSSLGNTTVSTPVPLTVNGQAAPNFTVTQARYLSTNANGSANMSFTMECGNTLTGSSLPTYACSTALLNSQLDYILIPDAYAQGTITVSQANSAFSAHSATSVGSLIVAPGGSDLNSNSLANGGFYTSNTSPLTTGNTPVYPYNLSQVFMLRWRDASGNTLSYLYFYVEINSNGNTVSTVSGCNTTFAGGSGTVGDPYQIADATTLQNTQYCTLNSNYLKLVSDINLGGSVSSWVPIDLYGQFDGNAHSISGLYINNENSDNTGLFGTINSGASVSNLTLNNVNVRGGRTSIGALAGLNQGTISNTTSSGTVGVGAFNLGNGPVRVGGLVGNSTGGSITNSSSSANVVWEASSFDNSGSAGNNGIVGGLVGSASSTSISNSFYTGNINLNFLFATRYENVGGFIGNLSTGSITNSYVNSTITVSASSVAHKLRMGQMVGTLASGGSILRGFATGTFNFNKQGTTGTVYVSGFLGNFQAGASKIIQDSYSMVTLNITNIQAGESYAGFVGGQDSGTAAMNVVRSYSANPFMASPNAKGFTGSSTDMSCTDCYLYSNATVPSQTFTNLTTYTTSTQMQTQSNFNFDFSTPIWRMPTVNPLSPNGLLSPVLNWQCGTNGMTCQ